MAKNKFIPYYGGKGGTMNDGTGFGGEPVVKKTKLSDKNSPMSMLKRGMQGKKS